jgi:hypothetical protein
LGGIIFLEVTAVIRLFCALVIGELQVFLLLTSLFDEVANLLSIHELQNLDRILALEQERSDSER